MNGRLKHIELTGKGFRLLADGRVEAEFDWIHITEIVAYRRDPEGADLLCLGFRASATRGYVEVDEETDGYSKLLPALYDAFSSINPDWWQDVAKPLGTNRQTIYGMSMSEENEEPAANKYLKSLTLQKKCRRHNFRMTLVMLIFGTFTGSIAGVLSVKSSAGGKWGFIIAGCMIQMILSVVMLRRIKPILLTMVWFALICWLAIFLFR